MLDLAPVLNCEKSINTILENLENLADSKGIVKAMLISNMYNEIRLASIELNKVKTAIKEASTEVDQNG